MPIERDVESLTERFVASLAEIIEKDVKARVREELTRLTSGLASLKRSAGDARGRARRPGRKLDMACRYPGCKNRSKGPRFHFLCEEHLKLGKPAIAKAKAARPARAPRKAKAAAPAAPPAQ